MRRRSVDPRGSTGGQVPYELAIGPHVPTWGHAVTTLRARKDTTQDALVTAYRSWSDARRRWLDEHDIPRGQQSSMIPFRRPYSGEPTVSGQITPHSDD